MPRTRTKRCRARHHRWWFTVDLDNLDTMAVCAAPKGEVRKGWEDVRRRRTSLTALNAVNHVLGSGSMTLTLTLTLNSGRVGGTRLGVHPIMVSHLPLLT